MTADLRSWAGLARSLVIYRARPWRTARLAAFYRGIVGPGDLAFDIGAHAGNRTRALLAAGARVVALEPQRLFLDFLRRDLPPEVTLLRQAAGRAPGAGRLAVSRLHPTVSSLAAGFAERMAAAPGFGRVRWDAAETVEIVTLDALIAAHGRAALRQDRRRGLRGGGARRPERGRCPGSPSSTCRRHSTAAAACVARLAALGPYEFNLVAGESG